MEKITFMVLLRVIITKEQKLRGPIELTVHIGVGSTDRRVGGSGRRTRHRKRVDARSSDGGHQGHEVGEVKPWEKSGKNYNLEVMFGLKAHH